MSTDTTTPTTSKVNIKLEFEAGAELPDNETVESLVKEHLASAFEGVASVTVRRSGTKRRLTDADRDEIVSLRKRGMAYKDLAERFSCSKGAINGVLREAGLTRTWMSEELKAQEAAEKAAAKADDDSDVDDFDA